MSVRSLWFAYPVIGLMLGFAGCVEQSPDVPSEEDVKVAKVTKELSVVLKDRAVTKAAKAHRARLAVLRDLRVLKVPQATWVTRDNQVTRASQDLRVFKECRELKETVDIRALQEQALKVFKELWVCRVLLQTTPHSISAVSTSHLQQSLTCLFCECRSTLRSTLLRCEPEPGAALPALERRGQTLPGWRGSPSTPQLTITPLQDPTLSSQETVWSLH